jgi:hypothetical protein
VCAYTSIRDDLPDDVLTSIRCLVPNPSLPYPDFLQLVLCGYADERDGGPDVNWTDIEGYETSSRLVSVAEANASSSNELLEFIYLDLTVSG